MVNTKGYSSGESDTDFETPFHQLSPQDQRERVLFLWEKAYLKSKGAAHVLGKFGELNRKIYLIGTLKREINSQEENLIEIKQHKWLIYPEGKFK